LGVETITEDGEYLYLTNVKAGSYKLKVTYSGKPVSTKKRVNEFNYQIKSVTQDSTTSGNWRAKYGKDGYMMFGHPVSVSSHHIPNYVKEVVLNKNATVVWDTLNTDGRVPAVSVTSKPIAAAIITKDPDPTFQTMTIDVVLKEKHPYKLSLYMLDFDTHERRSALEIFDLETLKLIAPVQLVKKYHQGKYITFSFNKSVRIRVNHIRGQNAAVSGLFFDTTEPGKIPESSK
jgi:alpha-L-rhamnosidase